MQFTGFGALSNIVTNVSMSNYQEVGSYLELLKGVSRISTQSLYLVDFYKGAVLYVFENPMFLGGISPEQILDNSSCFSVNYATKADYDISVEVIKRWFAFLENQTIEERKSYTLEFNYNSNNRVVKVSLTPILLCNDGKPWLVLCSSKTSTSSKTGQITILRKNTPFYWTYCSVQNKWEFHKHFMLSDMEQQVLRLSIQGKKETDICDHIFRSKDGLKSIKKKMFRKMDAKNITEAVSYALTYGLI